MIDWNKRYNSKLLLFGEYTVLLGSEMLAITFPKYFGQWQRADVLDPRLIDFFSHLQQIDLISGVKLNVYLLNKCISEGIQFKSNIREGYGIGSSGALSAASFDVFFEKEEQISLASKRTVLAQIENFFHGKSSGMDALAIYENKAIRIHNGNYQFLNYKLDDLPNGFFLLDSLAERKSDKLIDHFMNDLNKEEGSKVELKELMRLNNLSIEASIKKDYKQLERLFREISVLQFQLFDRMIHDSVKEIWEEGLESENYFIKVLGAGGGGYYLGWATDSIEGLDKNIVQLIGQSS